MSVTPEPVPEAAPSGGDGPADGNRAAPAVRQEAASHHSETRPSSPFENLDDGAYAGYATGSVVHADALAHEGTRLANVDVAFSGSGYSSAAIEEQLNELARQVAPALEGDTGFGLGDAIELDVLGDELADGGLIDLEDEVRADAPPDTGLLSTEVLDLEIDPILRSVLLRAQAQAQVATSGCVLGNDLAHGLGYVEDLSLIDLTGTDAPDFSEALLATSAPEPHRAVSQSESRTFLEPGEDGKGPLALVSETRQTIAPLTLFQGTENELTIEVLGEWVLRAKTDGTGSDIHYGPDAESPETPVLRILHPDGENTEITFQQFLGDEGLVITVPGVAEIAIGEDPRAIGGDAESEPMTSPFEAFAAVDVVRVQLLDGDPTHLADVRVGHMEVGAEVPEDGIDCPGIGLAKQADPPTVDAGDPFEWAVTVSNPNDCVLRDIEVTDTISATQGVEYDVTGTEPEAGTVENDRVIWNDLDPLDPGESHQLFIRVSVEEDSAAGVLTDKAVTTGTCGPAEDEVDAGVDAPVVDFENEIVLEAPEVDEVETEVMGVTEAQEEQPRAAAADPAPAGELPRTGTAVGLLLLGASGLVATGELLRRLRRG